MVHISIIIVVLGHSLAYCKVFDFSRTENWLLNVRIDLVRKYDLHRSPEQQIRISDTFLQV